MGQVFAAEQREPIQRRVALKVIKPGMDSREILARFEAERQAVALMDHASIARVYDAGSTDEGRPYFVMELVEGQPLTKFCDDRKLDLRERLELFQRVCQAVQHAHQKGIIHRDLKPSNILVTVDPENGDTPIPKIIDFGIAKALGPALTDNTLHTMMGQVLGTLQYMSPEQASFDVSDIDTRADIFTLGVILYELLTGVTPLEMRKLRKTGIEAALRAVTECEFSKPSMKLGSIEDSSRTSIAEVRRIPSAKLMQCLRGDLDWIVMKALEKERNRRYETANALALDVQRYLADEPVSASPPSISYQLRKFARRHRVFVSAATSILLVVLVAFVLVFREAEKARKAEEAEVEERKIAEREARKSREALSLSDFHRASELLDEESWNEGLAYLARSLEVWPSNERSLQRSLHLLLERNWSNAGHMEIVDAENVLKLLRENESKDTLEVSLRDRQGQAFLATFPLRSDSRNQYNGWTRYDQSGMNGDLFMVKKNLPALRREKVPIKGIFSDPVPVAYSPDGKWLAAPGGEELLLINRETGEEQEGFSHSERIYSVAFDPGSSRVATGGHDKHLKIWDIEAGALFMNPIPMEGVPTEIVFSTHGDFLLALSAEGVTCWRVLERRRVSPESERKASAWKLDRGEPLTYGGVGTDRVSCNRLDNDESIGEIRVDGEVLALRFQQGTDRLVVIHSKGAEAWDSRLQKKQGSVRWETERVEIRWQEGDFLVLHSVTEAERHLAFDAGSFRVLVDHTAPEPWKSVQVIQSGKYLLFESEQGIVTRMPLEGGAESSSSYSLGEGNSLYGKAWSDEDSALAFVRGQPHERWDMVSHFEVWDLLAGRSLSQPFYHSLRGPAALNGIAEAFCIQNVDELEGVGVYHLDGTLRFQIPMFPLAESTFSYDGSKVLVRQEYPGPSQVFDAATGQRFPLELGWMEAGMDPSGRFAFSHNSIWDIATGRRLSDPLIRGKGFPENLDGNEYWASMKLLPSAEPVRWVLLQNRYYVPFVDSRGLEAPAWYPELLRSIAGLQINDEGSLQESEDPHTRLRELEERIFPLADDSVFSRIAHWWLLPPDQRVKDPLSSFPK